MKGGEDQVQKYIDLLVPGNAKIKIIHGQGPVELTGSLCVGIKWGFCGDPEGKFKNYLWSCTLTSSNKEYCWDPAPANLEPKTEEDKGPKKGLLIKTAVLMPTAVKDEENVVKIELEGYNKQKVILTLFYLGLC